MVIKVAKTIKEIRSKKGLTQETLAARAGLTRSYISLIESGKKTPAIATLYKLANILNVSISEFLVEGDVEEKKTNNSSIYKNIEKTKVENNKSLGYGYEALFPNIKNKQMETFYIKILAGNETAELSHDGEEFMLVIKGKLKVTHGNKQFVLQKGDSAYIDSTIKHKFKAIDKKDAEFISLNTYKSK